MPRLTPLLLLLLPLTTATINTTSTSSVLTLSNARFHAVLNKTTSYITTLTLDGVDMLGKSVSATSAIGPYMDCVCTPSQLNYVPGLGANYSVVQGVDSVGVQYGGMKMSQVVPDTGGGWIGWAGNAMTGKLKLIILPFSLRSLTSLNLSHVHLLPSQPAQPPPSPPSPFIPPLVLRPHLTSTLPQHAAKHCQARSSNNTGSSATPRLPSTHSLVSPTTTPPPPSSRTSRPCELSSGRTARSTPTLSRTRTSTCRSRCLIRRLTRCRIWGWRLWYRTRLGTWGIELVGGRILFRVRLGRY